jgi:hypothetical protein
MEMLQTAVMARKVLYVGDYDTSNALQRPYRKGTETFASSRVVVTSTGVNESMVTGRG